MKILHCHPVVNVRKTGGCPAHRDGVLSSLKCGGFAAEFATAQGARVTPQAAESRSSSAIISHYSSCNAVSPRDLAEDTQSILKDIGSFKRKYSG